MPRFEYAERMTEDDKTPTSGAREQSVSLPMACHTQPCAALELLGEQLNIAITRIELCTAGLEKVREAAEQAKEAAQTAADGALAAIQSREPLSRKERFSITFLGAVVGGAVVAATIMVASSATTHLSGFFDPKAQAAPTVCVPHRAVEPPEACGQRRP